MADAGPPISSPATSAQSGLRFVFRALHSRNYRLFFSGQLVSLIGTWLTVTATSWLVYRLTASSEVLGIVNFAGQIPAFLLSPFAGVLVDRWRRHPLLLWTQTLSMLESFGLAAVAFLTAHYGQHVPHGPAITAVAALCGLACFQGLVNAFDVPGRQALVIQLVENPHDLPNAIALNSSMFNTARAIGPLVAGYLIYALGEGWCFTLDGISYFAVLIALLMMRVHETPRIPRERHIGREFNAGLRYAFGFKPIRAILLLLATISFCITFQAVLLPVFAVQILHGNALTQALLMFSGAIGSLIAAFRLAARKTVLGLGRQMGIASAVLGLGMILYGLSSHLWLSLPGMALIGFCSMTQMAAGNTLLQTLVEEDMRGRLMSLYTMAFMGMMPLGSLAAGFLAASPLGPQYTTALAGIGCMLSSALFFIALPAIRREIRPIYIQRGILLQTANALQTTEAILEEGERAS